MRALACLFLVACGGGSSEVEGDPLIQSTLMAQFNNKEWTAKFGFGRTETKNGATNFVMYVGSTEISCADDFKGVPRTGTYAVMSVPAPPALGNSSTLFNLTEVTSSGDLTARGTMGTVQMTAVNEMDVSAVYAFDSTFEGGRYAINGAVTMLRCP